MMLSRGTEPHTRLSHDCASVVAHHEVLALRDDALLEVRVLLRGRGQIRLVERFPVDVDDALARRDPVAREPDQPLHERPARAAARGRRRRVEDDDVAARGVREVVDEPVREHAVREARLAAVVLEGVRAVQRRLHRRGRDPVRVDDVGLDREDRGDRDHDREHPVDHRTPRGRDPPHETVDRISQRIPWSTRRVRSPSDRSRLRSRRHSSTRPWLPERSTSGTPQPRYSGGRV